MAQDNSSLKVVTNEVRLSYAHLFEPYSNRSDIDPKFSTVILIPKSDKAIRAALDRAEKEAIKQGLERSKFTDKDIKLNKIGSIIHDGDEEADLENNPEYEGHWYMTVSSQADRRPQIVDRALNPILDPTEVYSGCYARVSIQAFPYSVNGNKGVSFGLRNVQKLRDGEPLGGRTRAEDDFDALDDDDTEDNLL